MRPPNIYENQAPVMHAENGSTIVPPFIAEPCKASMSSVKSTQVAESTPSFLLTSVLRGSKRKARRSEPRAAAQRARARMDPRDPTSAGESKRPQDGCKNKTHVLRMEVLRQGHQLLPLAARILVGTVSWWDLERASRSQAFARAHPSAPAEPTELIGGLITGRERRFSTTRDHLYRRPGHFRIRRRRSRPYPTLPEVQRRPPQTRPFIIITTIIIIVITTTIIIIIIIFIILGLGSSSRRQRL